MDPMASKTLRLPLDKKAAEKIDKARVDGSRLNMEDINRLAGWDADAKFAQVRARLKILDNRPIKHQFIFDMEKMQIVHEFEVRV